jgi:sugar transferase EpsL
MAKRSFDFLLAWLLILLLFPVLILTTSLVFIFLGRPIFFSQIRPGHNSKLFRIFKFRTMTNHLDEHGKLLPDDNRLTTVGKWIRKRSLDELPQLWNVIIGNMSFVGPRPLLVEYLSLYSARQSKRHEVKPGISGWAQVNGRNCLEWEERLEMDVWYVENQSFCLDLKILWMSVLRVIRKEGINQPGQATVEKFQGEKR